MKQFPVGKPETGEIEAIKEAKNEGIYYTQSEFDTIKKETEYNGKVLLRIPKSLHKELAEKSKQEGVSLNQYAVYKLSR